MNIFDRVGFYGPAILGIMTLFILRNRPKWLFSYIIGYSANIFSIIVLKLFFKQPRPDEDLSVFYAKEKRGFIQFDAYGMPSGHAQSTVFSTFYIWLATKNIWLTFAYFVVSCLTMYQRLKYNKHTIIQLCVGAAIGLCVAYITYIYARRLIPGILKEKPDDDGPL
jgi:membrane-associated phospholipid phosphatase